MKEQIIQTGATFAILSKAPVYGILEAVGYTTPTDAWAGFAYGARFFVINGTTLQTVEYINIGTAPSASSAGSTTWKALDFSKGLAANSIVTLTGSTTITKALHANRTLLMGASGAALTFTLPSATGTGDIYKFVVSVVNTSNYIIATAASQYFAGNIFTNSSSDAVTVEPWISLYATVNIKITLDGTTKGGVSIGDTVEVQDIATATWRVTGMTTSSGTEASPFSTS